MKKMLIVMMHLGMGGAEKSLVNFLNELSPNDCKVDLLLFKKEGILLEQVPSWVNIIDTPRDVAVLYGSNPINKKEKYLKCIRYWGTLCATMKTHNNERKQFVRWKKYYTKHIGQLKEKYDIAISYVSGEIMNYVVEKVDAPFKATWVHTDYKASKGSPKDDEYYFEKLNKIITISDSCVNSIKDSFSQNTIKQKVICLPNIVSAAFVKKLAEVKVDDAYQERKSFKILSIGRLENVKGFDMAVEAAKILQDKKIDFEWLIIGEGSERKNLETLIGKYALNNKMKLLGLKDNPYPYLKGCDIVVQSSRFEGKSIALDEAKIFGKPIISTNYPTVYDQLSKDEGMITEMNPEAIAEGISVLYHNESHLKLIKEYLKSRNYGNASDVNKYIYELGIKEER